MNSPEKGVVAISLYDISSVEEWPATYGRGKGCHHHFLEQSLLEHSHTCSVQSSAWLVLPLPQPSSAVVTKPSGKKSLNYYLAL